jgi:hypothetical protein
MLTEHYRSWVLFRNLQFAVELSNRSPSSFWVKGGSHPYNYGLSAAQSPPIAGRCTHCASIRRITIPPLTDEPGTEDALAYLGDVICVRKQFEVGRLPPTRGESAGVRALSDGVHNRIRRECT